MQFEKSNNTICIQGIKQVSSGVYKIHPCEGPVFFIRDLYFGEKDFEKILSAFDSIFYNPQEGERFLCLNEEESLLLLNASETFLAERYAVGLLNRSEQSRFLIFQKLFKKQYKTEQINQVLDYLETEGFLSDLRFSQSWLRQRMRAKKESRSKLYQELLSRSIKSDIAKQAVDEAFEELDEQIILQELIDSYMFKKFSREKIIKKCIYYGFSLKNINKLL